MNKNQIEMSVCSVSGGKIKEYQHEGLTLIEAKDGSPFIIKIKNNSSRRALAVISVDGVCAISGKKAENSSEGYIVGSYSSLEVKGFRISDNEVAQFVFSDGKKSYATEIGIESGELKKGELAANNGVIGVKITWEKQEDFDWGKWTTTPKPYVKPWNEPYIPWIDPIPQWPKYPYDGYPYIYCRDSSAGIGGDNHSYGNVTYTYNCSVEPQNLSSKVEEKSVLRSCSFKMGTAFGEQKIDKVTRVSFEISAAQCDTFILQLHYASRQNLIDMGVDLETKKKVAAIPSAFGNEGYCKPPKNWKK